MYGIFSYIWLILMVNVGKYTIHGSYGYFVFQNLRTSQIFMLFVFMCSLSFLQTCSIHHGFYQVKSCQFTGNTLHWAFEYGPWCRTTDPWRCWTPAAKSRIGSKRKRPKTSRGDDHGLSSLANKVFVYQGWSWYVHIYIYIYLLIKDILAIWMNLCSWQFCWCPFRDGENVTPTQRWIVTSNDGGWFQVTNWITWFWLIPVTHPKFKS